MSTEPPDMPPELRDRLREESAEEQSDLEAMWSLLGRMDDTVSEADPETAWATLVRHHPELGATPEDGQASSEHGRTRSAESRRQQRAPRSSRPQRQERRWTSAAVGMTLLILGLVGGLWLWRQPVTITAQPGQQRTATLPDGSTVELNSGTTLAYRRSFQVVPFVDADRRTVRLEGEAFFEVAEGGRPFSVETATAQVTVEGTRFNVRARTDQESATEVTVVRGRVRVAPRERPNRSVVLSKPGHTSRVTKSMSVPTAPGSTNVSHVLAWRNEGFAVRARPLSVVIQELERRYDKPIHLHSSVDRPEDPVSLYYPEPTDLETILQALCTARNLNYRPTSRGFELFAGPNGR